MSVATCRHLGIMRLFPGLLRREDWNLGLAETRYQVRVQVLHSLEVVRLRSSDEVEAL